MYLPAYHNSYRAGSGSQGEYAQDARVHACLHVYMPKYMCHLHIILKLLILSSDTFYIGCAGAIQR